MTFEDFQSLARLSVIGALELGELTRFQEGLRRFGARAEEYVYECRRLETAMALSLQPQPPKADAKASLLAAIRGRR